MNIIAPIGRSNLVDGVTSEILYSNGEVTASIEPFLISEKEEFYGISNLIIDGEGHKFNRDPQQRSLISDPEELNSVLSAEAKIKIVSISPQKCYEAIERIDFIFRVTKGLAIKNIFRISKDNEWIGTQRSGRRTITRRNVDPISASDIERVKKLLVILDAQQWSKLNYFLSSAMEQVGKLNISGAMYVCILDSILTFPSENEQSSGYMLSMRFSRLFKKDLEFQKYIKSLYSKRNKIFHGMTDDDVFTLEDIKFLEEKSCELIEYYLHNTNQFTKDRMDSILLG